MMGTSVVSSMAFVVLLFTPVAPRVENKLEAQEPLLAYLMDSGEINQEMAELMWINCRLELIHAKEALENLELCALEEWSTDKKLSNVRSSPKEDMSRTVNVLHPQVKQILVDCLRERNLMFPISEEENGLKNWYTKYMGFLFARLNSSRRRELNQRLGSAPASAVLSSSPAPSILNDSGLQPTSGEHSSDSPNSVSDVQSSNQKSSKKTVVVAVVVTAAATFVVAALLFICCCRFCGTGSGQGRNDGSPLLSLSLSDYSIASSQKSFGLQTSVNEEKLGNQSFNNKLNNNRISSKFYMESHSVSDSKIEIPVGTIAAAAISSAEDSVQIPPGMLGTFGHPILKLPPGRTDPPKLPPGKTAPLPPPPPVPVPPPPPPPPPIKLSSGGPRPPPPVPTPPPAIPSGVKTGPCPPPPPPPAIPSGIKTGPHPPPPPPPVIPSGNKTGPCPPPPPPPATGIKTSPHPPPPPGGIPPPRPPLVGFKPPRPPLLGPNHLSTSTSTEGGDAGAPKAKLKPFFWDKVLANPDHTMVWHQIKSGSFQFNEEMIETLFGYAPAEKNKTEAKKDFSSQGPSTQFIQIIDSKKSQNISILLKALNVTTEEVCDALQEASFWAAFNSFKDTNRSLCSLEKSHLMSQPMLKTYDSILVGVNQSNELPSELIQTLIKMAPTTEEELKLRIYSGKLSQLGPADRFLKLLVDIPFAFKRLESLLFICTLQEETSVVKESLTVLEAACTELRKSRLFLKLLEAVLKTGNRMNDGTFRGGAQAFKLDTLLKLSDVKGTDGKTTLLHFVVQEIISSEGIRASRAAKETRSMSSIKSDELLEDSSQESDDHFRSTGLQVISGLGSELENVKKAAVLDAEDLTGTVAKLRHALINARDFLNSEMKNVAEENGFHQTLKSFVQNTEVDVMWLLEEEKRIMALVKSTADYFHGKSGKDEVHSAWFLSYFAHARKICSFLHHLLHSLTLLLLLLLFHHVPDGVAHALPDNFAQLLAALLHVLLLLIEVGAGDHHIQEKSLHHELLALAEAAPLHLLLALSRLSGVLLLLDCGGFVTVVLTVAASLKAKIAKRTAETIVSFAMVNSLKADILRYDGMVVVKGIYSES
ncbi:Formin-like protein 5 [Abeliophyllum distichum]|uniref:Formin-like protein n=1 Tax=Abeliophyllum distichum TaxID=126358 RepID=A0ABD1QJH7_9LAMI